MDFSSKLMIELAISISLLLWLMNTFMVAVSSTSALVSLKWIPIETWNVRIS